MSFFLGMTIKEAEIVPYQDLLENVILYAATLMLGLLLGTLCEASTLLNPKVAPLIILGVVALAVSGAVGVLGGWIVYKFKKEISILLLVLPVFPVCRLLLKSLSI